MQHTCSCKCSCKDSDPKCSGVQTAALAHLKRMPRRSIPESSIEGLSRWMLPFQPIFHFTAGEQTAGRKTAVTQQRDGGNQSGSKQAARESGHRLEQLICEHESKDANQPGKGMALSSTR